MSRIIYTDGACSPNPGVGGWGAVVLPTHTYQPMYFLSGALPETTNNEMELMAVVTAIASTPKGALVTVVTDSKYVCDSFNNQLLKWSQNGWKTGSGHSIKNKELWQYLYHVAKQRKVDMLWIKGHSGDLYNEIADCLAVSARMDLVQETQGPKVDESFFSDLSYFEATGKFLGKGAINLSKIKENTKASYKTTPFKHPWLLESMPKKIDSSIFFKKDDEVGDLK